MVVTLFWFVVAAIVARYMNRVLDRIEPFVLRAIRKTIMAAMPMTPLVIWVGLFMGMIVFFGVLGGSSAVAGVAVGATWSVFVAWASMRYPRVGPYLPEIFNLAIALALVYSGVAAVVRSDELWLSTLLIGGGTVVVVLQGSAMLVRLFYLRGASAQ